MRKGRALFTACEDPPSRGFIRSSSTTAFSGAVELVNVNTLDPSRYVMHRPRRRYKSEHGGSRCAEPLCNLLLIVQERTLKLNCTSASSTNFQHVSNGPNIHNRQIHPVTREPHHTSWTVPSRLEVSMAAVDNVNRLSSNSPEAKHTSTIPTGHPMHATTMGRRCQSACLSG